MDERQRDEIEALRAIFESDFYEVGQTAFKLRIVPNPSRVSAVSSGGASATLTTAAATAALAVVAAGTGPAADAARKVLAAADDKCGNHSAVFLCVRMTAGYPTTEQPEVALEKIRGLTQTQFAEVEAAVVREVAQRKGVEIVFDLAQVVQDYLSAHNVKPGSLHEQMMEASKAKPAVPSSSASSSSSGVSSTPTMPANFPTTSTASATAAAVVSGTLADASRGDEGVEEEGEEAAAGASIHKKKHQRDGIADIVLKEMERRMLKVSTGTYDLDTGSVLPGESPGGGGVSELA
jgi:hypothetical protein